MSPEHAVLSGRSQADASNALADQYNKAEIQVGEVDPNNAKSDLLSKEFNSVV